MITDEQLQMSLLEAEAFFQEEAMIWREADAVTEANDEQRIEKIVKQALHEAVIKETTTFLFTGFTAVLAEFASALLGAVEDRHRKMAAKATRENGGDPPDRDLT